MIKTKPPVKKPLMVPGKNAINPTSEDFSIENNQTIPKVTAKDAAKPALPKLITGKPKTAVVTSPPVHADVPTMQKFINPKTQSEYVVLGTRETDNINASIRISYAKTDQAPGGFSTTFQFRIRIGDVGGADAKLVSDIRKYLAEHLPELDQGGGWEDNKSYLSQSGHMYLPDPPYKPDAVIERIVASDFVADLYGYLGGVLGFEMAVTQEQFTAYLVDHCSKVLSSIPVPKDAATVMWYRFGMGKHTAFVYPPLEQAQAAPTQTPVNPDDAPVIH